jgi:hypothetical protein
MNVRAKAQTYLRCKGDNVRAKARTYLRSKGKSKDRSRFLRNDSQKCKDQGKHKSKGNRAVPVV